MTQTIDANILVYASHTASPFHRRARDLLEHLVTGPALTYIFWPAVLGYIRIVTHPTLLERPLSSGEAVSNIESLAAPAHIRMVGEGEGFWTAFRAVAEDVEPRGSLVPDAHLVALMHENGVSVMWSHDRDFRKFRGVTAKDPFDPRYESGFGDRGAV